MQECDDARVGQGVDTRLLSELDALQLEKLQLQAQLYDLVGERDALRTKRQMEQVVAAFVQLTQEIMERDHVQGWKLDLEHRYWIAPAPTTKDS